MTTTTQATKCIAVKTPFGLMYLESSEDGGTYFVVKESAGVYDKYLDLACFHKLTFVGYDSDFIETQDYYSGDFAGLLPITSNYGNTFP